MQLLLVLILAVHVGWIGFVIFGAMLTRGHRAWTLVHMLALIWGVLVEIGPWPCPLTLAELWADKAAGLPAYGGGCLAHALDSVIYPNLPDRAITILGVGVCLMNLAIYAYRGWRGSRGPQHSRSTQPR